MNRTILIVDDNKAERLALEDFLRSDYTFLEAESAEEALTFLRKNFQKLSAIVMRTSMPDVDGFELLRTIKSNAVWLPIPVIVTTEADDEDAREKAITYGANGFATKPFNRALLQHIVTNAIQLRETAELANTLRRDPLTGLLNRESFFTEAKRAIMRHEPGYFVLSCFDVENFKMINDQYGSDSGDEVLRHIGRSLNSFVASINGLTSRCAADTFAVLFPTELMDTEEIRAGHRTIISPECINQKLRIRIGRYLVSDTSLPVNTMFDRAAIAEESIKGRYDTYIANYDEAMRDNLLREQKIVNKMSQALKNGEFEAWLQPQYNHATGAMIGAEALMRWRREGRIIPPDEFIPIFERNGFIYKVDQFIWREVCILLRKWLDEGKSPLPISVNISRYDILQEGLVDVIHALVEEYCLPVELLRLEITESAFAESSNTVVRIVRQLIKDGFTVEIDDFGSGYSSLNTLKDVPASILKLDMKFFENTEDLQRGGNIIESVVRMAKWLGMAVIAEGVEEQAQADYLKTIGCYYIQGYYYAKPMTVDEYEKLVASAKREPELTRLKTVENLDNGEFWNPKSMETLIFNSYVGGACIFEYINGRTELLRANDAYRRELGELISDEFRLSKTAMTDLLDEENHKLLHETVRRASVEKKETSCELTLRKGERREYIRMTIRLIATAAERRLFYAGIVNMTEQREAERRQSQSAKQLEVIMSNINGGVSAILIKDDGTSQSIFHNEKYYELYGCTRQQARTEKLDVLTLILPEDLPGVMEKIRELKKTGKSALIDYRIRKRDGSEALLRANASLMSIEGYGDEVIASVVTDITEKKSMEDQLRFLNDSAHDILAQPDTEKAIENTLDKIRNYFSSDRACIIEYDRERQTAGNTYEICADGITSQKTVRQTMPLGKLGTKPNRLLRIDDVSATVPGQTGLRQQMKEQGIRSLFVVSLYRDGKAIGCIEVENPTKALNQVERLVALGDYISVLLTRRDLNRTIEKDTAAMKMLIDDTPGGFCRMAIHPEKNPTLESLNEGFCRMLGMSKDEVRKEYGGDMFRCLFPEDIKNSALDSQEAFRQDGQFTTRCRLRRKNGDAIWVMVFARFVTADDGRRFLNSYFTDITREKRMEDQQKELLDNLPNGAALYEYDGKSLAVIHINKRYWELVEREPVDYSRASVLGMIHPADRAIISQEIEAAIRQQRKVTVDVRIRCGESGYKPFCIVANYTQQANGNYLLYASYTLISERTMSLQEMIPVALTTMMSASEDYSYVKDKDLRYLGVSRSLVKALGLPDERDVIGKTAYELFNNTLADQFTADDSSVVASGKPLMDVIECVPTANGGVRFGLTSKYPITDACGNVVGVYGVSRDITAQKQTESQYKLLADSIPGGLASYLCTSEGVHIAYFNDGFCALFGMTRAEYEACSQDNPIEHIFEEDREILKKQYHSLMKNGTPIDCIYRIHVKDGSSKWIHESAAIAERRENTIVINAVLLNITENQEAQERLRISEEMNRIAIEHSGNIITRFDAQEKTLTLPDSFDPIFDLPHTLHNMPQEQIALGRVSAEAAEAYAGMFESILRGSPAGTAVYQQNSTKGWRWLAAQYTTVFSSDNKPVSAVISFADITEKLEKDVVYNKWHQSLDERPADSYTLLRCNLSRGASYDSREGGLLTINFDNTKKSFNDYTAEYVKQCVYSEDRDRFNSFANAETMLSAYYRGRRSDALEYRERREDGTLRWLRLSADLVEYPNSRDVEAYLMFEDIDEQKKAELLVLERSETDPLTGVLNRTTFIARMDEILHASRPGEMHALFMLDVDNFKQVNDTMGHGAGDQVLRELTQKIGTILRRGDLIGRLGGDEFFVLLVDIPGKDAVERKAKQLCSLKFFTADSDVAASISMGIAMIPGDGADFDALYKKVDAALYREKKNGKNGFQFVSE